MTMTNYTTFDTEGPSALERKMSTSHILRHAILAIESRF